MTLTWSRSDVVQGHGVHASSLLARQEGLLAAGTAPAPGRRAGREEADR